MGRSIAHDQSVTFRGQAYLLLFFSRLGHNYAPFPMDLSINAVRERCTDHNLRPAMFLFNKSAIWDLSEEILNAKISSLLLRCLRGFALDPACRRK